MKSVISTFVLATTANILLPSLRDARLSWPRYVVVSTMFIGRWSGAEARVVWRVWMATSPCLVSCVAKWRCLAQSHWCCLIASGKSSLLVGHWFVYSVKLLVFIQVCIITILYYRGYKKINNNNNNNNRFVLRHKIVTSEAHKVYYLVAPK